MYQVTKLIPSETVTATKTFGTVKTLGKGLRLGHAYSNPGARVSLIAETVTGTSPTFDVEVFAKIEGKDFLLHTFTQITAAAEETESIPNCPADLFAKVTAGGTTPSAVLTLFATR